MHTFMLTLLEAPEVIFAAVKRLAAKKNMVLLGDDKRGAFFGYNVGGTYNRVAQALYIRLDETPGFLLWTDAEATIRAFFSHPQPFERMEADKSTTDDAVAAAIVNKIHDATAELEEFRALTGLRTADALVALWNSPEFQNLRTWAAALAAPVETTED